MSRTDGELEFESGEYVEQSLDRFRRISLFELSERIAIGSGEFCQFGLCHPLRLTGSTDHATQRGR